MSCKWYNTCPLRSWEKKGRISDKWKKKYCKSEKNWKNCERYQATEEGNPHPDNLLPDGSFLEINN